MIKPIADIKDGTITDQSGFVSGSPSTSLRQDDDSNTKMVKTPVKVVRQFERAYFMGHLLIGLFGSVVLQRLENLV